MNCSWIRENNRTIKNYNVNCGFYAVIRYCYTSWLHLPAEGQLKHATQPDQPANTQLLIGTITGSIYTLKIKCELSSILPVNASLSSSVGAGAWRDSLTPTVPCVKGQIPLSVRVWGGLPGWATWCGCFVSTEAQRKHHLFNYLTYSPGLLIVFFSNVLHIRAARRRLCVLGFTPRGFWRPNGVCVSGIVLES